MRKRRRARGRAAGAEGADQDALPARLHDLPGAVRRHPRAGRRVHLPRAQRLMSAPTIPVSEPAAQPEPVSEPDRAVERASARRASADRQPARARRGAAVAPRSSRASSHFGLSGQALVGAVFCPTLVLLAAIDAKHRLLPNAIILPASLAVGLIVAASTPGIVPAHLAAGAALGGFFFLFGDDLPRQPRHGRREARLPARARARVRRRSVPRSSRSPGCSSPRCTCSPRAGSSARKDAIPFGPFLALGGIVAFFLS